MLETTRVGYSMVGHPGQRLIGNTFNAQPMALPYSHAALTAALQQAPSHHILAQAGLTRYDVLNNMSHNGYDVLQKQQHSPMEQQQANSTSQTQQDHPIGYGAFGVVW